MDLFSRRTCDPRLGGEAGLRRARLSFMPWCWRRSLRDPGTAGVAALLVIRTAMWWGVVQVIRSMRTVGMLVAVLAGPGVLVLGASGAAAAGVASAAAPGALGLLRAHGSTNIYDDAGCAGPGRGHPTVEDTFYVGGRRFEPSQDFSLAFEAQPGRSTSLTLTGTTTAKGRFCLGPQTLPPGEFKVTYFEPSGRKNDAKIFTVLPSGSEPSSPAPEPKPSPAPTQPAPSATPTQSAPSRPPPSLIRPTPRPGRSRCWRWPRGGRPRPDPPPRPPERARDPPQRPRNQTRPPFRSRAPPPRRARPRPVAAQPAVVAAPAATTPGPVAAKQSRVPRPCRPAMPPSPSGWGQRGILIIAALATVCAMAWYVMRSDARGESV